MYTVFHYSDHGQEKSELDPGLNKKCSKCIRKLHRTKYFFFLMGKYILLVPYNMNNRVIGYNLLLIFVSGIMGLDLWPCSLFQYLSSKQTLLLLICESGTRATAWPFFFFAPFFSSFLFLFFFLFLNFLFRYVRLCSMPRSFPS